MRRQKIPYNDKNGVSRTLFYVRSKLYLFGYSETKQKITLNTYAYILFCNKKWLSAVLQTHRAPLPCEFVHKSRQTYIISVKNVLDDRTTAQM